MRSRRIRAVLGCALAGILVVASAAQANLPAGSYAFDGELYSIARSGSDTYVGGSFTMQQAATGGGLILPAGGSGEPDPDAFPHVAGTIVAVVSDGAGGWYIAGRFSAVDDLRREGVAHIEADGSVDASFDPHPAGGEVLAVAVSGSTVYLGGNFRSMDGRTRTGIAAVDADTGFVTDFDPNPRPDPNQEHSASVQALVAAGSTIYVGGAFTHMGGQARKNLAALDAATGTATAFSADANALVYRMIVLGSKLYVGGLYTTIGGVSRSGFAAVDGTTGAVVAGFAPELNGDVYGLAASGSTIYAGGDFGLRSIDADTGAFGPLGVSGFFPHVVLAVGVVGSTVYVGGQFRDINGADRHGLAAVDATTSAVAAWDPNPGDIVTVLATAGNEVYAGGRFAGAGPALHNARRVAKLTADGDLVTDFEPEVGEVTTDMSTSDHVDALAASGTDVYFGGQFSTVGPLDRHTLAAVDATTGQPTSFNDEYGTSNVRVLHVAGSTLYIGGDLGAVDGQSRHWLASVDLTTDELTPLNPAPSPTPWLGLHSIGVIGSTVYVGGAFDAIGGENRNHLAAFNATTGAIAPWNPNANGFPINAVSIVGPTIYVGGGFTKMGVQPRRGIAAVNATTGAILDFDRPDDFSVPSVGRMTASPLAVYASGLGSNGYPNIQRYAFASYHPTTGARTGFEPEPIDGGAAALATSGSTVYLGGNFRAVGGKLTGPFAQVTDSGGPGPQTTISTGPANGSSSADGTPTFAFSGAAGTERFRCRIDDGEPFTCETPFTTGALGDGEHTFSVAAIGSDHYVDLTPAARAFTVTPPVTPPPPPAPGPPPPPPPGPAPPPPPGPAPPPPPGPGPSAPFATFTSSPKSLRASKSGRFTYAFDATPLRSGKVTMTSTKKVKIGSKKTKMKLGTKSFTPPASGDARVRFKLSAKNLRALKKRTSVRFAIVVTVGSATFKATLTLKPPKA